jgi:hypothetical protein
MTNGQVASGIVRGRSTLLDVSRTRKRAVICIGFDESTLPSVLICPTARVSPRRTVDESAYRGGSPFAFVIESGNGIAGEFGRSIGAPLFSVGP